MESNELIITRRPGGPDVSEAFFKYASDEGALTYIASPYSHENPMIRQLRADRVGDLTAALLNLDIAAVSPIVHGHALAVKHPLPTDFKFWGKLCRAQIYGASIFLVHCQDGYALSVGVQAELEVACKYNKMIFYTESFAGLRIPPLKEALESPIDYKLPSPVLGSMDQVQRTKGR